MTIPSVPFGSTGRNVTRVGLGGEGILRTTDQGDHAGRMLEAALSEGIGYFDTAPAYSGSEGYLGELWQSHPGAREKIFHTSKSAERDKAGALADLDNTLATLGTDYLDLWQIHDVRTMDDVAAIEAPNGALAAFQEAKEASRVRHIGVTGHHDPAVLTHCVQNWPVDSVLLPVNPVEAVLGGFLDTTLPAAKDKGLAVIGMKVLGGRAADFGGNYLSPEGGVTAELLLQYALSKPVTTIIVGCALPEHVATLAAAGRDETALPAEEQRRVETAFEPYAKELAFYRGVI
jgi:aryl-alcohol dehydrogenase-like predicted oxidoreductase